jgi:hypothetical protein
MSFRKILTGVRWNERMPSPNVLIGFTTFGPLALELAACWCSCGESERWALHSVMKPNEAPKPAGTEPEGQERLVRQSQSTLS